MITVMLVDDEPFIRESLKALVAWEEHGFSIVHETYNGKEALNFLKTGDVDIIITDIKMPVMDGLELIEQVHLYYPQIKIVVLSAFDEFHLVKQAFKLGVQDYMLKSEMEEAQVIAVLKKIQQDIAQQHERENYPRESALQETYAEDHIFEQILTGDSDTYEERKVKVKQLEQIGCRLSDDITYVVLLIKQTKEQSSQFELFELMRDYPGCFFMGSREQTWGIFFTFSGSASWSSILSVAERFFKTLSERLHVPRLMAGLSSKGTGMEELVNCYRQASVALHYGFLRGKGKIITYSSIQNEHMNSSFDPEKKAKLFRTLLNRQDFTGLHEKREAFYVKTVHLAPPQIDQTKRLFILYSFYIHDFFDRYPFSGDTVLYEKIDEFNEWVRPEGDLNDHNLWLDSVIASILKVACGRSQLIHNAVHYIHNHLHEDISLSTIAEHLQVSEPYLSRKFSNELGIHLTHFISKIKMEKAAEFLKSGTLKIYEIAEMVGYNNPEHFSRVFKRIMGKSPKQFTVR